MMLSHQWAIGCLFGSQKVGTQEIDSFLRYGIASTSSTEPRSQAVDDKVAEILRSGKVVF